LGLQNYVLGLITSKTLHHGYCKDGDRDRDEKRGKKEDGKEEEGGFIM
jgi:hypothetical protein